MASQAKTPQAVQSCHRLLIWLVPMLDHFPRSRRYTLGQKIEHGVLAILEQLIQASYSQQKTSALEQANIQLNLVIHLWRIALELKVIGQKRYQYGVELMLELGRQIGGWRKFAKQR